MNREEYLQKMQAFRETLQSECKSNREILDRLAKEHKERARAEADLYDKQVREQRDAHTAKQHEIEHQMHLLKVEWAREHPVGEVKVIE